MPIDTLGVQDGQARTLITVGVGEMQVSADPQAILATYSLGSCIGLACYDPVARIGGLLHSQLPLSSMDAAQAATWPARFTDTGTTALLQALFDLGARRERLVVKAAGGSSILDEQNRFRIGERNQAVLRKVLWKNQLALAAEDLGGNVSRTVHLHLVDGRTVIRSGGQYQDL